MAFLPLFFKKINIALYSDKCGMYCAKTKRIAACLDNVEKIDHFKDKTSC